MKRICFSAIVTTFLLATVALSNTAEAKQGDKNTHAISKTAKFKKANPGRPPRPQPAARNLRGTQGHHAVMPNPGAILPLLEYRQKCLDSFWGTCPKPAK